MGKPRTREGYPTGLAEECERLLGTLLRGMGPWRESVYLVGGLVPRYLVTGRGPHVPRHAGTSDVDVVVNLDVLQETEAYLTLEKNLKRLGFERGHGARGDRVSYRWQRKVREFVIELEILVDAPGEGGQALREMPGRSDVSALVIPHASIVFDFHETVTLDIELLDEAGRCGVAVRHADIVSFTCLKAFAFADRAEPKDAHDLVYCLGYCDTGLEAAARAFATGLASRHEAAMQLALDILRRHFITSGDTAGHLKDGPVAVARFEWGGADDHRERRLLRQREASDIVTRFVERVTRMGA